MGVATTVLVLVAMFQLLTGAPANTAILASLVGGGAVAWLVARRNESVAEEERAYEQKLAEEERARNQKVAADQREIELARQRESHALVFGQKKSDPK